MPGIFDQGPGAWGNPSPPFSSPNKERVIKCPGCSKLIYADKAKMDEHFASGHEKNVYNPVEASNRRPIIVGLPWHQQIAGMIRDYPQGILIYTGIVLVATLLLSLLRFSK